MFCENVKKTNLLIKRDVLCSMCVFGVHWFSSFSRYRYITYNESRTARTLHRKRWSFKLNLYVTSDYGHLNFKDISSVYSIIAPSIIQHTLSRLYTTELQTYNCANAFCAKWFNWISQSTFYSTTCDSHRLESGAQKYSILFLLKICRAFVEY